MRRNGVLAGLAALAATVTLVPAADGAVKRGAFAGTTSEDKPLRFKVDRRGRVHSFHFERVTLTCTDGDTVTTPAVDVPARERFGVRRNRFGIRARNDATGFGWDAEGRFRNRGRRATGTLRVFATFDERGEQDAAGAIRCTSEPLTWTARRGG